MAETASNQKLSEDLLELASHPLRVRSLILLSDRTASPKELATLLGARLSNVSYHINILLDMGMIELVREEPRRGSVEHFYRAVTRPVWSDEEWSRLPIEERQRQSAWVVKLVTCDIADALASGTFNVRADTHTSRVVFWADEKGWRDVNAIQNRALREIQEVEKENAARLAESDGAAIRIAAALLCTELPAVRPSKPD